MSNWSKGDNHSGFFQWKTRASNTVISLVLLARREESEHFMWTPVVMLWRCYHSFRRDFLMLYLKECENDKQTLRTLKKPSLCQGKGVLRRTCESISLVVLLCRNMAMCIFQCTFPRFDPSCPCDRVQGALDHILARRAHRQTAGPYRQATVLRFVFTFKSWCVDNTCVNQPGHR